LTRFRLTTASGSGPTPHPPVRRRLADVELRFLLGAHRDDAHAGVAADAEHIVGADPSSAVTRRGDGGLRGRHPAGLRCAVAARLDVEARGTAVVRLFGV